MLLPPEAIGQSETQRHPPDAQSPPSHRSPARHSEAAVQLGVHTSPADAIGTHASPTMQSLAVSQEGRQSASSPSRTHDAPSGQTRLGYSSPQSITEHLPAPVSAPTHRPNP